MPSAGPPACAGHGDREHGLNRGARAGLSAVGQVDSLATTVCEGTCTNMFCPLMPEP